MKTYPLLWLLIALPGFALCQEPSSQSSLSANNSRITILNGGDFFTNLAGAGFQIPKNNGSGVSKHTIYSGSIWIGGYDEQHTLHLAAMTYRQRGVDFWPGPTSNDSIAAAEAYDRILKFTETDINQFKKDYDQNGSVSNPPNNILNYPGNGITAQGEPLALAPFIDRDKDGLYEPKEGDYPMVKGISSAYCLYNDNTTHKQSNGKPLEVEVHQLFYQDIFLHDNKTIDDVNFGRFLIVNRSSHTYRNVKVGFYIDFDLGYFGDDFVGTDSALNMVYVYNGDNEDEGGLGYGINPPAQGAMVLNRKLSNSMYYENTFDTVNGNPIQTKDYMAYLNSEFKDGSLLTHQGKTKTFVFDGDPVAGKGWTEESDNRTPGDRRILAVIEERVFAPNDVICIDLGFIYDRGSSGPKSSLEAMKAKAKIVKDAYEDGFRDWNSGECMLGGQDGSGDVLWLDQQRETMHFRAYPNPTSNTIKLESTVPINPDDLVIRNSFGVVVNGWKLSGNLLEVDELPNGIYWVQSSDRFIKLIIQR